MAELKIGDEGETDSRALPKYRIVAKCDDGRFVVEMRHDADEALQLSYLDLRHNSILGGPMTFNGVRLLPPKPKTETLREWMWMDDGDLCGTQRCESAKRVGGIARPADITYRPDGWIESIVFVNEPPTAPAVAPPRKVDAETFSIIWERLRKVGDACCFTDLREAVDDVIATLEDAGWGGGNGGNE